jgi:hypothetical protein
MLLPAALWIWSARRYLRDEDVGLLRAAVAIALASVALASPSELRIFIPVLTIVSFVAASVGGRALLVDGMAAVEAVPARPPGAPQPLGAESRRRTVRAG